MILAGVKAVTVHDTKQTELQDLGAQFFLSEESIGKNRAEACRAQLQELNTAVEVSASTAELTEDFLGQYQVRGRGGGRRAAPMGRGSRGAGASGRATARHRWSIAPGLRAPGARSYAPALGGPAGRCGRGAGLPVDARGAERRRSARCLDLPPALAPTPAGGGGHGLQPGGGDAHRRDLPQALAAHRVHPR